MSKSPRFHTALHCPDVYDQRRRINKVDQVIVTTYEKAKMGGKSRCKHDECMSTPYYWWKEGEELIK